MLCEKCGREIHEDDKFCAGCGATIEATHRITLKSVTQQIQDDSGSPEIPPTDPQPDPIAASNRSPFHLIIINLSIGQM